MLIKITISMEFFWDEIRCMLSAQQSLWHRVIGQLTPIDTIYDFSFSLKGHTSIHYFRHFNDSHLGSWSIFFYKLYYLVYKGFYKIFKMLSNGITYLKLSNNFTKVDIIFQLKNISFYYLEVIYMISRPNSYKIPLNTYI